MVSPAGIDGGIASDPNGSSTVEQQWDRRRVRADDLADPIEAHHKDFRALIGDVRWTVLWDGGGWLEGPSWSPAARQLVFSDIPGDRLMRWDEATGAVGVFRHPAGYPNGTAYDRQGRILVCEQGRRRITRTEHDGTITVIADSYQGSPLNSPNDLVVRTDGTIYFTDPPYGISGNYEGVRADPEQADNRVYRIGIDGVLTAVADGFQRPTGIGLSPDERWLYVADSRTSTIRAFLVAADGTVSNGRTLVTGATPSLDSMAIDEFGRIWIGALDGVHCYDSDSGELLGKIRLPDAASHVEWGGRTGNTLFVCATTALCAIRLTVRGAATATP
jgi:gluconolactonase